MPEHHGSLPRRHGLQQRRRIIGQDLGPVGPLRCVGVAVTARAVVAAALARCETRGSHQRRDHPDTDPSQARSSVVRLADGRVVVDAPVAAGACG